MTINGTLFVQMMHFLLAYLFIDKIFLKKAVHHILQERQERQHLIDDVQQEQEKISYTQQKKKATWQQYKHEFRELKVEPRVLPSLEIPTIDQRITMPEAEQEQLKSDVRQLLLKRVVEYE